MATKFKEYEPRYMFEELGYEYKFVDGKENNCENVIIYTHKKQGIKIQFNLLNQLIYFEIENKFKDYDKIGMFITKELLMAINKQKEELGWDNE
ncbi:MAG: hypothetical protein IJB83_02605 [Bacilli bacterium]|nr:hypothetical protein [Bacilli bacterium]